MEFNSKVWLPLVVNFLALQVREVPARTYLQLPLRQWGASNFHLLVLFSQKVNISENPIAVMGL